MYVLFGHNTYYKIVLSAQMQYYFLLDKLNHIPPLIGTLPWLSVAFKITPTLSPKLTSWNPNYLPGLLGEVLLPDL